MQRFEQIYEEHRDAVRAYVRRRAPEDLVEDVVADVFVVVRGIAADGVATVAFVDGDGNVLDSTPVTDNLFASKVRIGMGVPAAIEALDDHGNVLSKQKLPR